jgi:HSP20 family protein
MSSRVEALPGGTITILERRWSTMANLLTRWDSLGLTEWDPFRELQELRNRMASLLGRTRGLLTSPWEGREEALTLTEWVPLVDIAEDDKEYTVKVELPGVRKEDVKVTVEDDVLTISGERKIEKEEKGRRYHRVERSYGAFERSFTLPDDALADKIHADFKDGVLQVHIPKGEKAHKKAVEIRVE